MTDTPVHVRADEDELFYVLEGEHVFVVGDEEHELGPGGMVFAPRGIPHQQRRVVPGEGRLLVMTTPAGLEGFFRALVEQDAAVRAWVAALPERQRLAVFLRYFADLDHQSIAVALESRSEQSRPRSPRRTLRYGAHTGRQCDDRG